MNILIFGMALEALASAILSQTGMITLCSGQQYICAMMLLISAFVAEKFNP